MKITIVQTEIEAAIRTYIRSIISVREGMRIDMELRATRGDEGFIANIDILPDTNASTPGSGGGQIVPTVEATVAVVQEEPAPVVDTPAPDVTQPAPVVAVRRQVRTPRTTAPATEAASDGDAQLMANNPAEEPQDTLDAPRTSIFGGAKASEEVEQANDGTTPLKRSIFSDLKRPSNSEPASAEA